MQTPDFGGVFYSPLSSRPPAFRPSETFACCRGLLVALWVGLGWPVLATAQPVTALNIEGVTYFYDQPYLLDFNLALRDQNDRAVLTDPTNLTVVCREDGVAISPSETGFRLLAAANKQLRCFLVLDYTLSMADPTINGDADNDGVSDAIDTMEAAAKTLIGTLGADAQIGIYEFHREDAGHPPRKVTDLTVDKAALTNHIDRIWLDYVQFFPAGTRVWDAVYAAVNEFPSTWVVDEQRVVVFLSDGRDESSSRTPADIISVATSRGVKLYAIGFGRELTPAPLQNLAASTGGRYYAALSIPQLAERFQQITDDLRGNYTLRWATLKRSSSFIPSFSLTYQGLSATYTGVRYYPDNYTGDVLQGRLVFDAVLDDGVATLNLRAAYVPRFITRIRFRYTTDKPITVARVPLAEGGVCPDNWGFEHNIAEQWVEFRSPNPQNIFTALPFATQGRLFRLTLTGVTALRDCFTWLAMDNALYQSGGQSFVFLNSGLVGRLAQLITFVPPQDRLLSMSPFTVWASASSGLPVNITVVGGPATLVENTVTLTGTGLVTLRAEQVGNDTYSPDAVEYSFEVFAALPHNTPLEWLARYGLTSNLVQAELADLDGDGQAMWQEYVAGTNPDDRDSVFAVQALTRVANGWQLTISTEPYRTYRVEYAEQLNAWQTLKAAIAGDGQPQTILDESSLATVARYYRVVITEVNPVAFLIDKFVWIPPGKFTMGSPATEMDRGSDEGPQTRVTISKGFWLGKYEVAQRDYLAVMGANPSFFIGGLDWPVERVSWDDALNYCRKLTQQERGYARLPAGYEYQLPTEAQWEYACRAGTTTATAFGNSLDSTQANFDGNNPYNSGTKEPYLGRTSTGGTYAPNALGLYDMHGNVWEWCLDWYGTYPGGNVTDPIGPVSGSGHVFRGGGWFNIGGYCRSAIRHWNYPSYTANGLGFRVAIVAVP